MAADTYSDLLGLLIMGTGNDNNSWGANANTAVFTVIEEAIAKTLTSIVTGGTLDFSASPPPAAASQARYAVLSFSGVLAADQIVQVPNLSKIWLVNNATTGAFPLTFKTPTGTASAAIPAGTAFVYCDGSNNISVGLSTNLRDVQWLGADGTAAAPGIAFSGEPGSGVYRKSAGVLGISILGTEILEVSATAVNVVGASTSLQVNGAQVIPAGVEEDYAGIDLPVGGWLWEDGAAYSRPIANGGTVDTYKALFNALTKTLTASIYAGSSTINNLSIDPRFRGLKNAYIEGTGIPTGTKIVSLTASSITMSNQATGNVTTATIRILPHGQGDASTTFNVPDRRGRGTVGRDDMGGAPANRLVVNDGTALATVGGEETHTLTAAESVAHSHTFFGDAMPAHSHSYSAVTSPGGFGFSNGSNAGQYNLSTGATSAGTPTGTLSAFGSSGAHNNMHNFGICNKIVKY